MTDYAGNSNKKAKTQAESEKQNAERPTIERIVSEDSVITTKRTLGQKFKALFVKSEAKSVFGYVMQEVVLPSVRNAVVDSVAKGIERLIYGETRNRPGSGGMRVSYSSPVYRDSMSRGLPSSSLSSPRHQSMIRRIEREQIIISSREEAEEVLRHMDNIIEQCNVVTVAELNQLLGLPFEFTDDKWGWDSIVSAQLHQNRQGWLLDLPDPSPIS